MKKDSEYINRSIGSNTTEENNYAYQHQLINGYETEETLGTIFTENRRDIVK